MKKVVTWFLVASLAIGFVVLGPGETGKQVAGPGETGIVKPDGPGETG